ncbi:TRAF interacting protein no poles isoform X3 [Andrena cerasifolii]|uniref:TRAF interacting protein no poles isoform X3 n=1 Tax=Andrena cerasifolii TaxID=2819439 RepID=UPI004037A6B9
MNIVCIICSDLLVPSDDVFYTPCGHIFHFVCLTQWLESIQTLLEASTEDTDEVISRTCDPNTLITYISVMKREMLISLNKRRDLRSKIKSLQQELTTVSLERKFLSEEYTKRKKLEEDLLICESEKMFLENKLKDRERNIPLVKKTSSFTSETAGKLNSNLNTASKQAEIGRIAINSTELEKWDIPVKEKDRSIASVVQKNEKDSPYLQVKSGGAILKQYSNQKRVMKTNSSILTKRSRMEEPSKTNGQVKTNMITYNGFGGHSKLNHFPSTCGMKVRGIKDGHE